VIDKLRRNPKPIAAATLLVLVLAAGSQVSIEQAVRLVDWIRTAGPAGALVYSAVYTFGTVAALPASWLQGGAGFLWGPVWGPLFAWLVGTAVGTLNFLLGRTLLRSWVEEKAKDHPRFAAIDGAIGEDGLMLVILLRLSPLSPHNIVSYGLGLTPINLRTYVMGTLLGSMPAVVIWSTLGASLEAFAALLDGSAAAGSGTPWILALVLTAFATVGVTVFARRALSNALGEQPASA